MLGDIVYAVGDVLAPFVINCIKKLAFWIVSLVVFSALTWLVYPFFEGLVSETLFYVVAFFVASISGIIAVALTSGSHAI